MDITDNEIPEIDERMTKVETKLNSFNITPSYVSVNGRIVKAEDAIDDYDLVTQKQLNELEMRLKNIL